MTFEAASKARMRRWRPRWILRWIVTREALSILCHTNVDVRREPYGGPVKPEIVTVGATTCDDEK